MRATTFNYLAPSLLCLIAACGFPRPADVPEPISCTANEFIGCDGNSAQTCNETGDGAVKQECGVAGCNADAKRCNQCVPSSDSCGTASNEIDHCGADGLPAGQDTCALACVASPKAHCAYLEPRYLPNVCDSPAAMPMLVISGNASIDTGLDTNCTGGVVHQDGAADICVVRYDMIHVVQSKTLTVSGSRALALVADHALAIDGMLDVSAHGRTPGPGGSGMTSGDAVTRTIGGGGAGFATGGAAGGSSTTDGGGGVGGSKVTNPTLITVLIGGTTPTRGLGFSPAAGGGGGAATLIACRGEVSVTGTLSAGGGGGGGGSSGLSAGDTYCGAGGGAGGNVVLQGLSIRVTGQVYANGGGGGAGYPGSGPAAQSGIDGELTPAPSPGGHAFAGEGAGGSGGWRDATPTVGLHPTQAGPLAGGGGGSVGFFQTYTPTSVAPTLTPSSASPVFSANKNTNTR
jgi:hypothetical protein